jgi:hypothetical protein
MSYDKLIVVTSARWVADDLRAAGTIGVEHSLGMDAPTLDGRTALWCSGAWALRLLKSGVQHPFLAAGPHWLTTVPAQYLRRDVWAGTLGDMPYKGVDPKFYKLAEHKHSGIPAGLSLGRGAFRRRAFDAFDFADGIEDLHFIVPTEWTTPASTGASWHTGRSPQRPSTWQLSPASARAL